MDTVDFIIKSSTEFYNALKTDENGRYRSWEYCYSHFIKTRGSKDVDYDYLSLQLAFYLASWGMYRGSSFLLQKDYKIHIPVVKELLSEKYDTLAGIECSNLRKESNQKLLQDINSFLEQYYDKIRREVKEQDLKVATGNYNIKSIMQLVDFYEKNADQLEYAREKMEIEGLLYPQMKMIDMGFWQIGFDLDTNKGIQNTH